MKSIKSPLRYPGGKTRACSILEKIINDNFDMSTVDGIASPFFGGGSFEFYMSTKYNLYILANDLFTPLVNFWLVCKNNNSDLCNYLYNNMDISKDVFIELRNKILVENQFNQACYYFILNRCSFSGCTLSGGFSQEASKKRYTKSSIDRIKQLRLSDFDISDLDFEEFINTTNLENKILFLDPPYYIQSKLYGTNGDLQNFDHERLYSVLSTKNKWIMTYNDCPYIRDLYRNYKIINAEWSYSMSKKKESSEIVIVAV